MMNRICVLRLTFLLFLLSASFASYSQDYINHHLSEVEQMLREEGLRYNTDWHPNGVIITVSEPQDTASWTFNDNNICIEYLLIVSSFKYDEVCQHLSKLCYKIMENVYLNSREHTVTYLYIDGSSLYITTRPFDPSSPNPPIFYSHSR
jgi:hypothetical protein